MGRRKLAVALQYAGVSRDVAVRQVRIQAVDVQPSWRGTVGQQGLQLRRELKPTIFVPVKERFFSGAVSGKEHRVIVCVVQREGEHPVQVLNRVCPPLLIRRQDYFRVALRAKMMAAAYQALS